MAKRVRATRKRNFTGVMFGVNSAALVNYHSEETLEVEPLAMPAPPPHQLCPPEHAEYVASRRGRVYYWADSPLVLRIRPENRVYFRTEQDALASGRTLSRAQIRRLRGGRG